MMDFEKIESLEILIEKIVRRILNEQNQNSITQIDEVTTLRKTTTLQTAQELEVSRQTLNKWETSPRTKMYVTPFITRIGNKLSYDIEGLKKSLKMNAILFNRNGDYKYKYDDVLKRGSRYSLIEKKILAGQEINSTEEKFYRAECKTREVRCFLSDKNK